MHSGAMFQTIESNLVNSARRLSGELGISVQGGSSLYNFSKCIQSSQTVLHIIEILQNFWCTLVQTYIQINHQVVSNKEPKYILCVCIYIYIYIYIYTHTHVCVCMCVEVNMDLNPTVYNTFLLKKQISNTLLHDI